MNKKTKVILTILCYFLDEEYQGNGYATEGDNYD